MIRLLICAVIGAVPGFVWPFDWPVCAACSLAAALVLTGRQFCGSRGRRILYICTAASFSVAAALLAWWLRSLISLHLSPPDLPLRVLLFISADLLLSAGGAALLGWRHMSVLSRGICALLACWSMELTVCALFLLNVQHDEPAQMPAAVLGVCIFCAGYIILTIFFAVYLRREIIRIRWEQAAQSELQEESERFAAVSRQLTTARQLRHDFNNHLMIIQSLAHDGEYTEALRYMQMLRIRLQAPEE